MLAGVAMDEDEVDRAKDSDAADQPEHNPVQLSAHERLIVPGLETDPAQYGAPQGGAQDRVHRELQVVHPDDPHRNANQVAHDREQPGHEDAEAAELCSPGL